MFDPDRGRSSDAASARSSVVVTSSTFMLVNSFQAMMVSREVNARMVRQVNQPKPTTSER